MSILRRWYRAARDFLAPVAGTVYGWLNAEEVRRIAITSTIVFVTGNAGWRAYVAAILADPAIWSPQAPPLALTLAATIVEIFRRLGHGPPGPPGVPPLKVYPPAD